MRFAIVNLGCKVNRVESDAFGGALLSYGHEYTEEDNADLVIVNTCTVTGEAEKKTRKTVRQVLKRNPSAQVIVTGCAAVINPSVFLDMSERIEVVAKSDMEHRLTHYQASKQVDTSPTDFTSRTRRGIKVQDGCDNACTYCIVHVARGRATSRPVQQVVDDVVALHSHGVREIVLSGINIGSYDYEGMRLSDLLKTILDAVPGFDNAGIPIVRFRISSVEPMDLDEECIEVIANSNGRVCSHLHLPLQSGSSKVLREMGRPYDAEDFRALVRLLRAHIPGISLSTDVIVGFPGESDDDFQETLDLVNECGFSKVHVFPYSKREGTPAAQRFDQIDPQVKACRAAALRELSEKLRSDDFESRSGTEEFVLVEENGLGMTDSYFEIPVSKSYEPGCLVKITL